MKTKKEFCILALVLAMAFVWAGCSKESNPEKKTYLVTFNSSGGSPVNSLHIAEGNVVPRPVNPVNNYLAFVGWFKEKSCLNRWDFESDAVTATTTLYAKWETVERTVTFDTNGGSLIEPLTVHKGTILDLSLSPSKKGLAFGSWFTDASLTTVFDLSAPVTEDITLYAQWVAISYAVGDYYPELKEASEAVGVVFFLTGEITTTNGVKRSTTGKIVSLDEAKMYHWGQDVQTSVNNPLDGAVNMQKMKEFASDLDLFPAFAWCNHKNADASVSPAGIDWYLPAINELQAELYPACSDAFNNKITNVPGGMPIAKEYYWSSSEAGILQARLVTFQTGNQSVGSKQQEKHRVRAISSF